MRPLPSEPSLHRPGVRLAVAVLALLWLAGPYWPGTVDDVYISVGYARQWVETGALTWTDGVRVEGYSNFLMVALLAAGMALGADGGLWAQGLALLSSLGVLVGLSWALPRNREGTLALLGVAVWASFCRWSVVGMETTLFALLLAGGTVGVLRGGRSWGIGIALLVLASVTRLEGAAHLGVGLLLRARGERRWQRGDGIALVSLVGLAGYHAVRVAWYGDFWPTPYLVKVGGVPWTLHGVAQGAADLVTAAGILGAAWAATRPKPRMLMLALAPLGLQLLVLARASGDWMAHGRLVLPGVIAAVAGMAAVARARGGVGRVAFAGLVLAVGVGGGLESGGWKPAKLEPRRLWGLDAPVASYRAGLDSPFIDDLDWMIEHLPAGASVYLTDAGMLTGLDDWEEVDLGGLVTREVAEHRVTDDVLPWILARVEADAERTTVLRVARVGESWVDLPPEMARVFPPLAVARTGDVYTQWFGLALQAPSVEQRHGRWATAVRRFPSQPELRWRQARSLARHGEHARARRVLHVAAERWPADQRFRDEGSIDFVDGTLPLDFGGGRGFVLYSNGTLRSRPLDAGELARLELVVEVDDPGDEGGLFDLSSDCGRAESGRVDTVTHVPLDRVACAGTPPSVISVSFLNDDTGEGHDRNLYIRLAERDANGAVEGR